MADRREGLSVSAAAEVAGLSPATVRRWVDNWIAQQDGAPLPYPGQGLLKGWRAATRRGAGGGPGDGRERRVDEEDARRVRRENSGRRTRTER